MIFAPEYGGVCSWRIGPPPAANRRYAPSGDQLTAPMRASSAASFVSRPSETVRTHNSLPRAIATRAPSGDGTPLPPAGPAFAPRPRPPVGTASGSSRGGRPSRSDTYRFETPARSQVKVTCRPSADHAAFDG